MGDILTTEGFDHPWTNRKGARRLVLALPTPNGGHFYNEMYKHFGSDGETPISGVGRMHTQACNEIQ